ncbi:MAG: DNA-directed RNA polymerase subunit alpha [Chloroflexi bacterium]|nr:DNA-directed RNA polymerase subunit alpha [Chloroflexota bacterium]
MEPLESGFGITLGNAIRRVLLGSLTGAAITWVKIEEVQHEFSTITHVKENTTDLLLNVKQIRLRALSDRPGKLVLGVAGEGKVTAGDIQPSADYEIANPELHLATLDSPDAKLNILFNVEQGRGYVPASQQDGLPIGIIPVDAIFTPIRRVNYTVEHTRVGQMTNYDRLILDVWTDSTMTPVQAVNQAALILMRQLHIFGDLVKTPSFLSEGQSVGSDGPSPDKYDIPIEELGLSVRAHNCLKRSNITKVGQILQMSQDELLGIKNFGYKSFVELQEKLAALGFTRPSAAEEPDRERQEQGVAVGADEGNVEGDSSED